MSNKLVLVLNCGSSSLKFAVIDAQTGDDQISGLAECFGLEDSRIKWKINGEKHESSLGAFTAHREAVEFIVNKILAGQPELAAQIQAVGHRIVHGGEKFTRSVIIDEHVIKGIEECSSLAPLHNPAHLIGIRAAIASFLNCHKWRCSILRSTKACQSALSSTPCHTNCTVSTVSAVMACTALAIYLSAVKPLKC